MDFTEEDRTDLRILMLAMDGAGGGARRIDRAVASARGAHRKAAPSGAPATLK